MIDETPFEHVERTPGGFRLPRRKWRELLFIGALVADGDAYVRDPSRPMPAFRDPDLFPEAVRFRVIEEGDTFVRVEPVE